MRVTGVDFYSVALFALVADSFLAALDGWWKVFRRGTVEAFCSVFRGRSVMLFRLVVSWTQLYFKSSFVG